MSSKPKLSDHRSNKFQSKYSPGKSVSAGQYIAEIMCEKFAKTKNKELSVQFWKNPDWAKHFKLQLFKAQSLLKLYSPSAIIRAINSKDAKYIYSLGNQKIDTLIEREENILKQQRESMKKVTKVEVGPTDAAPRPSFVKPNNQFKKLDEL